MVLPASSQPNSAFDELIFIEDYFRDEAFVDAAQDYAILHFGHEFMYNHDQAIVAREALYATFPRSRAGDVSYPMFYGGHYIDDNGNLVVLVVGDSASLAINGTDSNAVAFDASMEQVLQVDTMVSVRDAVFTFSELNEALDVMEALLWSDLDSYLFHNLHYWYLDVIGNRVVVGLDVFNEKRVADFRQTILDSPMLYFRQGSRIGIFDDNYTVYQPVCYLQCEMLSQYVPIVPFNLQQTPGTRILPAGGGLISVGFRARRLCGTTGFVTVAHGGPTDWGRPHAPRTVTSHYLPGNPIIGEVTSHLHVSLNQIDAAFVSNINGINRVSNQLPFIDASSNRTLTERQGVSVGSTVFMHGAPYVGGAAGCVAFLYTGRVSALRVLIYDIHSRHGRVTVTAHAVQYNAATPGGTSGGIVFTRIPGTSRFGLTGVHMSRAGHFVPAESILSGLGLQLW